MGSKWTVSVNELQKLKWPRDGKQLDEKGQQLCKETLLSTGGLKILDLTIPDCLNEMQAGLNLPNSGGNKIQWHSSSSSADVERESLHLTNKTN